MKMPYGKYKGREVEELPSSYLLWVAENWREDSERDRQICEAADKEWQEREKNRDHFEEG
jgi:hypothetical protein